jgi:hypothetical protein
MKEVEVGGVRRGLLCERSGGYDDRNKTSTGVGFIPG